jgi:hypothetical protein
MSQRNINEFNHSSCNTFDDKNWHVFHHGTTVGPELSIAIAPITARHVRLNILKPTDGPTIREFQLYAPSPEVSTSSN